MADVTSCQNALSTSTQKCGFSGGGMGGCFELNSTTVEFLPRLDQGRCPMYRGDIAIGPYS